MVVDRAAIVVEEFDAEDGDAYDVVPDTYVVGATVVVSAVIVVD